MFAVAIQDVMASQTNFIEIDDMILHIQEGFYCT